MDIGRQGAGGVHPVGEATCLKNDNRNIEYENMSYSCHLHQQRLFLQLSAVITKIKTCKPAKNNSGD